MNCASRPVPRTPNVEVLRGVKCLTIRSSRYSRRLRGSLFRYALEEEEGESYGAD